MLVRSLCLSFGTAALLTGCGGTKAATDLAPDPTPGVPSTVFGVRSIVLATNHLVYDATRNLIWVSPAAPLGASGTVVALDPATGNVMRTIVVGSGPNALALSDDDSTLYVGLDGTHTVRRVDLRTGKPGPSFRLADRFGASSPYAIDLAVQPGTRETVAVSVGSTTGSASYGPVVVDGVAERPNAYNSALVDQLVWNAATSLTGFNSLSTNATFARFDVDASGVTLATRGGKSGVAYSSDLLAVDGRIYTTDGTVLDATTLDVLGRFALPTGNIAYGPAVDLADRRAYFIETPSEGDPILHVMNLDTYAEVTSRTLPPLDATDVGNLPGRSNLILSPGHGLTFRTIACVYSIDAAPVD